MADGTPRSRDPRGLARQNLIAFQCGASRAYRPGLQHQVVATVLHEVAAGRIDRVLFEAPPRHGKTRQIGVDFPAHFLGNNPDKQVAYTTYAQDRANDVGLEVRNLVSSEYFASVFPGTTINARRNAAKRFSLNRPHVGGYQAVGIGGPLTGRGADLLVMDDTIKDRVMADSPKSQRRAREWFSSVAYTRLEPGARIVSMMTRWASNDLHGHIEREHTSDGWLIVRLPAMGGPGDFLARDAGTPLWPERWGAPQLERIRNTLLPRDWLALYQQAPSALEGSEFKRDWFRRYINTPSKMTIYGSTDYAVTGDGGDWTVLLVWGIDHLGEAYLLDAWRGQTSSDVWAERQLDMQKTWRCMAWFGEAGPIRSSVEPFLQIRARERKIFPYLVWLPSITDKVSRARSFQARAAMGMIYLPHTQIANEGLEELCSFPTGSTDDFVDACTVFGRGLDMVVAALATTGQDSPGPKPFTAQWLEYEESKNAHRLY